MKSKTDQTKARGGSVRLRNSHRHRHKQMDWVGRERNGQEEKRNGKFREERRALQTFQLPDETCKKR